MLEMYEAELWRQFSQNILSINFVEQIQQFRIQWKDVYVLKHPDY